MESSQTLSSYTTSTIRRAQRRLARPTAGAWVRHGGLFLLTAVTTTIAGVTLASSKSPDVVMPAPGSWFDYLIYLPLLYLKLAGGYIYLTFTEPGLLVQGLSFSGSLLAILTAHEFGHYIACRLYGVDCTLPFFIPSPPLLGPGTFGAFIKMRPPIPSRHALFDIGVAGPLAGFIVLIPVAVIGLMTAHPAPPMAPGEVATYFNDPLLMRLMAMAVGVQSENILANPFYMAAWIGLLVTSLNLLPVGQLDGGHAVYAVFGMRVHRALGRVAFVTMALLAVIGWIWHRSPGGFLYVIILGIMLRVGHPLTEESEPLGRLRQIVAVITLLVFALSFWPFPITIG